MRFHRSDLPGILIATLGPAGLMLIFLSSFDVWSHHGTPLLGAIAGNLAIGGGLLAAFTRFIRRWDLINGLLIVLSLAIATVITLQQTGGDDTAIATIAKWVGVISFLGLNVIIPLQFISNGLIPLLNRREAKQLSERES